MKLGKLSSTKVASAATFNRNFDGRASPISTSINARNSLLMNLSGKKRSGRQNAVFNNSQSFEGKQSPGKLLKLQDSEKKRKLVKQTGQIANSVRAPALISTNTSKTIRHQKSDQVLGYKQACLNQ